MRSSRRALAACALAAALASLAVLAQPAPPPARANLPCDAPAGAAKGISGGLEAVTGGAIGLGNPVGDACNAVSGALTGGLSNPITGALKGLGNDVFAQITAWVSEGASWLIGRVVSAIETTTTPELTGKGFLEEYAKMATIAALLGAAMLLLAVLEGLAQGNAALLLRAALVHLPLAFIATSVAYLVVQLLLGVTDGLSEAIASATGHDATRFFEAAITGLVKTGGAAGGNGAAGAAGVPLFVTFLAAAIGALAAFFVWIELLMRDAAVYVVALFSPLALAASIWPRWTGALRRTAELLVALIASKFAIVAVVALAASLLANPESRVEHLLGAAALMLLAGFAPFVLLKLMPFAEGALGAAYGRRSATGGASGAMQIASDVQILRNMARSGFSEGSGVKLWSASEPPGGPGGPSGGESRGGPRGAGNGGGKATGGPGKAGGRPGPGGNANGGKAPPAPGGAGSGASGASDTAAVAGGGGPSGAAAIPAASARTARGAAERLEQSGTAKAAGPPSAAGARPASRPQSREETGAPDDAESPASRSESPPRPAPDPPGAKSEKGREG